MLNKITFNELMNGQIISYFLNKIKKLVRRYVKSTV